jgi:uncharacterized damage-inducible protein DinB
MNYGGKQLAASFRTVRGNTIRIAEDIPESQYDFQVTPDTRSVAKTLMHIATFPAIQMYMHQSGLEDLSKLDDAAKKTFGELATWVAAEDAKPRGKAEIIAFLKTEGEKLAAFLDGLSDGFLSESVKMAPGAEPAAKTRLEMLLSPKEHEMHHRGQLMLMERMLGIVPHLTRRYQEMMAAMAQSVQR